jgi:hypothetical protein
VNGLSVCFLKIAAFLRIKHYKVTNRERYNPALLPNPFKIMSDVFFFILRPSTPLPHTLSFMKNPQYYYWFMSRRQSTFSLLQHKHTQTHKHTNIILGDRKSHSNRITKNNRRCFETLSHNSQSTIIPLSFLLWVSLLLLYTKPNLFVGCNTLQQDEQLMARSDELTEKAYAAILVNSMFQNTILKLNISFVEKVL